MHLIKSFNFDFIFQPNSATVTKERYFSKKNIPLKYAKHSTQLVDPFTIYQRGYKYEHLIVWRFYSTVINRIIGWSESKYTVMDRSNNFHFNVPISSITLQWFKALSGTNGMAFLLDFCRNPFPDIKTAALTLLKVVVTPLWGQKALEETAGFVEFLMDRNVEFDKDAIHEKHKIIEILSESTTVFDSVTLGQLKKYVQQGAFYVEGVMDVVAEGQS